MKNNQKFIDDVERAKDVCQRWLNHIERQKQNTITLQKAATLAKKGDRQGAMRLKSQVDNQPKVFDGASFEDVMPTILKSLKAMSELVAGGGSFINWKTGFPTENGMYLVELEDGENIVTYYTHTPRKDTWGDTSRTGWTCLTGSHTCVKKWVNTKTLNPLQSIIDGLGVE